VNGPILNVASYEDRPKPRAAEHSRAPSLPCNTSRFPRHAIVAVGGFDEAFHLYGWEIPELGRASAAKRVWRGSLLGRPYIWHHKAPSENTIEVETAKSARKKPGMRRRSFVRKQPSRAPRDGDGQRIARTLLRGRRIPRFRRACSHLRRRRDPDDALPTPRSLAGASRSSWTGMYTKSCAHARGMREARRVTARALLLLRRRRSGRLARRERRGSSLQTKSSTRGCLDAAGPSFDARARSRTLTKVLVDDGGRRDATGREDYWARAEGTSHRSLPWATSRTARVPQLAERFRCASDRRGVSTRFALPIA